MRLLPACSLRKRRRNDESLAVTPNAGNAAGNCADPPTIVRMYERGMCTSDIAHVLGICEREVTAALVKRPRKGNATSANISEMSSESAVALVARLLEDPPSYTCPILHALMDDPVVAEDGWTYEREGILDALQRRSKSPMTNDAMGHSLVPNRMLKSQIIEFKERVVAETILVVPRLAPRDAGALLARADSFIRPKLPDHAARRWLTEILKLQVKLPTTERGTAATDLVALLADDEDTLTEALDWFAALCDTDLLASLEQELLRELLRVSVAQSRPAWICNQLGSELTHRFAAGAQDDQEPDALRAMQLLWEHLQWLTTPEHYINPEFFTDHAAVILAGLCPRLRIVVTVVQTSVLKRCVELAGNRAELDAVALAKLGSALPSGYIDTSAIALTEVYVELASRQAYTSAFHSLCVVHAADPRNEVVRRKLVELLTRGLRDKEEVDETLLFALLFEDHAELPRELLPHLRLLSEELQRVPVPALLAMADQLENAGLNEKGSIVMVTAAQLQQASGDRAAAARDFIRAYSMDRRNDAAADGVVDTSAAAGQQCMDLQERCESQQREITQLQLRCADYERQVRSQENMIHRLNQKRSWLPWFPRRTP